VRVLLARAAESGEGDDEGLSLLIADHTGGLVASVDSLVTREISAAQLNVAARGAHHDSLLAMSWRERPEVTPAASPPATTERVVVLGEEGTALARSLEESGVAVEVFEDLRALGEVLDGGGVVVPGTVVLECDLDRESFAGERSFSAGGEGWVGCGGVDLVLPVLQGWLGNECFVGSRLVLVTCGGVAGGVGEVVSGLGVAGVWGLVRCAQVEHPGRFVLVDVDGEGSSWDAFGGVLGVGEGEGRGEGGGESQFVIRDVVVRVPRLERVGGGGGLVVPGGGGGWCLGVGGGTLEGLSLVAAPGVDRELGVGEVRVGVRAGGLNFRDVLIALGMYPDGDAVIGGEGAGVVLEVGRGVEGLVVGDRVMGLFGGFGPVAVADERLVVGVPEGWSFARAAGVPTVFLTAYFALVDLAGLRSGERVLVHAGAGGVGMAAVQLARCLGAEVFATASPGKWGVLRSLGLDEAHIASSRSLEFGERFLEVSGGRGVDVVLNSLAGEFVDVSLGLLGEGGRFVEMGKTDVRAVEDLGGAYPGVSYRAFDLLDAGAERIGEMFGELIERFSAGELVPLPLRAWDVRRAPEAFRFMSQARHVGKNVLMLPPVRAIDPDGTVLITGGTGALGSLVARHLVVAHGARSLLLVSRGGLAGEGARELKGELEALGARVRIEACDVSERESVRELLGSIAAECPLRAVVHTAGLLEDSVIESLSAESVERVFAVKARAAWNLHELTERMDLGAFVLFSSAAGVLGSPGQANYAAANAFLDALAAHRRARGLPALSLAWGLWDQAVGGMAGGLSEGDRARMARAGVSPITSEQGLECFDMALDGGEALVVGLPLDLRALRVQAREGMLPALLSELVSAPARRHTAHQPTLTLAQRLAGAPEDQHQDLVLELVREQVATVLGHHTPETVNTQHTFKELGFDSLTAVELRNRLNTTTGLHLPATLIFDYPTTTAVAAHILGAMAPDRAPSEGSDGGEDDRLRRTIASIPISRLRQAGLIEILLGVADPDTASLEGEELRQIDTMDVENLLKKAASESAGEQVENGVPVEEEVS
jgi:mycoketide-CoA synthase